MLFRSDLKGVEPGALVCGVVAETPCKDADELVDVLVVWVSDLGDAMRLPCRAVLRSSDLRDAIARARSRNRCSLSPIREKRFSPSLAAAPGGEIDSALPIISQQSCQA